MEMKSYGYNICYITINESLTPGTKTKVGTVDDFNRLINLVRVSGIIVAEATIGTQYMSGTLIANPYQDLDGIECYTVSAAGSQTPYILQVQVTKESDGMYVQANIISL